LALDDTTVAGIDAGVRRAAYQIIEGKGATYYGIGSALARITRNILSDRRSIMTVCTPTPDIAGVKDVTVSLPRLVGGDGVLETYHLPLNAAEGAALNRSAALIRGLIDQLDHE
jgi:L-lactate dehydrogenase